MHCCGHVACVGHLLLSRVTRATQKQNVNAQKQDVKASANLQLRQVLAPRAGNARGAPGEPKGQRYLLPLVKVLEKPKDMFEVLAIPQRLYKQHAPVACTRTREFDQESAR